MRSQEGNPRNTDEQPTSDSTRPGGAAQFDPAQQTVREDLEEDPSGAEGPQLRGSLPPGTKGPRQSTQAPAVPGSSADRGERPSRDARLGT
jgi:hypothetical protein